MKEVDNDNIINEEENSRQAYENGSPAKKVVLVLKDNKLESADLGVAKNLAGDYEKLYDNANKPEATAEDKEKFASAAVLMQNSLKNCLANHKKVNPDSFSKDPNVANLYAAYSENSHATVKALQEAGGDVFNSLIKTAHADAESHKIPRNEEEERLIENDIAKLLYLSHLKYEYENVTGSEIEKKQWRSEILTELISDKFEENIEKFKENPICSEVIKHHKNVIDDFKTGKIDQIQLPRINSIIYEGFHNKADENYQSIYPLVYNSIKYKRDTGRKDQNEIDKVKNAVSEIDMMKALYSDIFLTTTGNFPISIDRDPAFDTLYMKRSSHLNGTNHNYAKFLKDRIDEEKQYEKDIIDRQNEYRENYDRQIKNQEELIGSPVVQRYISEYATIPSQIEKTKKLMAVEQMELDEINSTYWKTYEKQYNDTHKKKLSEKSLNALKRKQGDKPVNSEAETKQAFINGYKKSITDFEKRREEVVGRLEKDCGIKKDELPTLVDRYNVFLEIKQGYTKVVNEKKIKAKQDVDHYYEEKKKEPKRIEQMINNEAAQYEIAKKNNNIADIEKIKADRAKRDEERKKADPAAFACLKYNNKNNYVARNTADVINNIKNDYRQLKNAYFEDEKVNPDKKRFNDETLDKTLFEFESFDKAYNEKPSVSKPDRSNNVIQKFNVEVAPEMSITEFDIAKVKVNPDILRPGVKAEGVPFESDLRNDFKANINNAYSKILEDAYTFRKGSPEYKAIQDGLKELKKVSQNADLNMKDTMPKCRKIIAIMDQYIDRKFDEMDAAGASGEKKKSRYRRIDVMNARGFLKNGLDILEMQYGLDKNDYVPDDIRHQIEYAAELKKVKNPEVDNILDSLKKGDRLESQKLMQDYLLKNVNKYKKPEGGYTFKFNEEDPGKRIPTDKNERMFSVILKSYEKLVNSNLLYYQKKEINKFPKLVEAAEHINFKNGIGKSVSDVLGIKVDMAEIKPVYKLVKTDNALDYAKQFDESYKCRISMFSNDVFRNYMKNGKVDPEVSVTSEISKELVNDAFSSVYLNAVDKNEKGPFNFEEVDLNRRKMLTVIHNTPITKNVEKAMKEYFKIYSLNDRTPSEVHEIIDMNRRMIKNPASFNKGIVSAAISYTAEDTLKEVNEMMNGSKKFNKDKMKTNLELLDKTSKIAKSIGLTSVLDRLNSTMEIKGKGKTFNESLKKIQGEVSKRNVRKQINPASKVSL